MAKHSVDISRVVIWCDYACIDQDNAELQGKGISSLISYTARSNLLLTPVRSEPEAMEAYRHATHPTDLHHYGERAWCRL